MISEILHILTTDVRLQVSGFQPEYGIDKLVMAENDYESFCSL